MAGSQLWTTGGALIYVSQANIGGGSAAYLGTARIKPYIELVPEWSLFYSDETGRKVPRDKSFDMEHAWITAEMNRIDESVYENLTVEKYAGSEAGQKPGQYGYDAMGTMVIAEEDFSELWMVFPYSALTSYAGQPAGYHFPSVVFTGPEKFTDLGVTDRAIAMTWHALPLPGTPGNPKWTLYDFNVSGLPAPS
jgi:hypothetical protein